MIGTGKTSYMGLKLIEVGQLPNEWGRVLNLNWTNVDCHLAVNDGFVRQLLDDNRKLLHRVNDLEGRIAKLEPPAPAPGWVDPDSDEG